jgi:hypothetical protein
MMPIRQIHFVWKCGSSVTPIERVGLPAGTAIVAGELFVSRI